jgi:hypothetical protein
MRDRRSSIISCCILAPPILDTAAELIFNGDVNNHTAQTGADTVISLTVISPAMDVHQTGCADIAKVMKQGWTKASRGQAESTDVYEGRTFEEAVLAMDTDLAGWFGEKPYQTDATAWSWANCQVMPCARKLEPKGFQHPALSDPKVDDWMATPEQLEERDSDLYLARKCGCNCGGSPKGKKSRFLPGHDMRVRS